jgi:hypothetical protein
VHHLGQLLGLPDLVLLDDGGQVLHQQLLPFTLGLKSGKLVSMPKLKVKSEKGKKYRKCRIRLTPPDQADQMKKSPKTFAKI